MSWNFPASSESYSAGGASWMYAATFPDANLGQYYDFSGDYRMAPDSSFFEPIENDDGSLDYTNS